MPIAKEHGQFLKVTYSTVSSRQIRTLPALTSLRFIAAIAIVLIHSGTTFGYQPIAYALPLHQAVSFFFVLSGFVLFYNHPGFASRREICFFYTNRLARIWPAHIITAMLAMFLTPRTPWPSVANWWIIPLNIFMLHAWVPVPSVLLSLNVVSWALSVEIFFYACFPLLTTQWPRRWHWLMVGGFFLAVSMVALSNHFKVTRVELDPGISVLGTIYMNPLTRLFEFILGMAAASVFRGTEAIIGWTRNQATVVEMGIMLLGILVMRLCLFNVQRPWLGDAGQYYLLRQGGGLWWAGLIVIFALGRGWLSWLLAHPVAVRLGEISFSLYLVHALVVKHFEALASAIKPHQSAWFCAYWIISLTMAYALWYGVENPLRRLLVAHARRVILLDEEVKPPSLIATSRPMGLGLTGVAGVYLLLYFVRQSLLG